MLGALARLFAGRASHGAPTPEVSATFPIQKILVPGKLTARVYFHEVATEGGSVTCWSYITDGLRAQGQEELVFTLRLGPGESPQDFPEDPLAFFRLVFDLACQGQIVAAGDISHLRSSTFLGHSGLLYADAQPLPGISGNVDALALLMIEDDELEVVQAFGATRLLSLLGRATRHYPWPPWSDRKRTSVVPSGLLQESMLANVARVQMSALQARLEAGRLTLRVAPRAQAQIDAFLSDFADEAPVAFLTGADRSGFGSLVWKPGNTAPEAITPAGGKCGRVIGSFVLFIPMQSPQASRLVEDGFGVMLTPGSWAQVRQALRDGKDLCIGLSDDAEVVIRELAIAQVPTHYANPIDGKTYETPDGWEDYSPLNPPSSGSASVPQRVRLEQLRLLTSQQEFGENTTAEDLKAFLDAAMKEADTILSSGNAGNAILIQFDCLPGSHTVRIAYQGDPELELLQRFRDALEKLASPPVKNEGVSFQVEIRVVP